MMLSRRKVVPLVMVSQPLLLHLSNLLLLPAMASQPLPRLLNLLLLPTRASQTLLLLHRLFPTRCQFVPSMPSFLSIALSPAAQSLLSSRS
ncbi:hypothetical protein EDB86DRAFT_2871530 [Lactarius hatsudake]|nr:hypothetical protein EDB86DRAFT_2871530 [Lactarius hatsudake]